MVKKFSKATISPRVIQLQRNISPESGRLSVFRVHEQGPSGHTAPFPLVSSLLLPSDCLLSCSSVKVM